MNTNDLINLLASAGASRGLRPYAAVVLAAAGGLAAAAVLFGLFIDLRPDIETAAGSAPFLLKLVLAAILAFTASGMLVRLARPDGSAAHWRMGVLGSAALLAAAVAIELLSVPHASWPERLVGFEPIACLASIVALSVAPLLLFQFLMRWGAPRDPGLAGAVCGLAAVAIATAVYAAHCPNDSPLFVLVWYTAAVLIVCLAGRHLGRRLLRW
ncbi:MAG TPA: DUF1109 domain-containing protein [Aestuariivirgaceae bacterium]|jgi:hypothetical protein